MKGKKKIADNILERVEQCAYGIEEYKNNKVRILLSTKSIRLQLLKDIIIYDIGISIEAFEEAAKKGKAKYYNK